MIQKIERKTIFHEHKIIADEIFEIQKVMYDPDSYSFENEAEKEEYIAQFDILNETENSTDSFHNILSFDHPDLETYPKALSKKLIVLFSELNATEFLIVSHLKTNLFGDLKTDHPQLKQAYGELKRILGCDYYDQALKIGIQDLEILIPIIFWMQRIDPSSPEYIYFFDEKNRFSFCICKYGKVHITAYGGEIFTSTLLSENNWKTINTCLNSLN
jgi:hypothetical protein